MRIRRRPHDAAWELVHPRCARERFEDLDEVQTMLEAGEVDVAIDELRWLLSECSDFVEAHRLLGELALGEGDVKLARAHFGYAYDACLWAMPPAGPPGKLPYAVPANQPFFEAAKGLAWCLHELDRDAEAIGVLDVMLKCDAVDPLGVSDWRAAWSDSRPADQ